MINDKISFLKKIFGSSSYLDGQKKNYYTKCPNPKCKSHLKNKLKFCILLNNFANHCWVCDLKSNNLYYIIKRYKPFYLNEYINRYKDLCNNINFDEELENKEEIVSLPQPFIFLPTNLKSINPNIKKALNYLKKRGLNENDLWKYKIGICGDGFTKFSNRIIFPSFDNEGKLNYFVARTPSKNVKPPYFTCDKSHTEIIFNEYLIDFSKEIILVEGIFDAIKTNDNTIPLLGSILSKRSLLFKKLVENSTPVVVSLDKDEVKKSNKIANMLYTYGIDVKVLEITNYKDIGEMPKGEFQKIKSQAIPWSPQQKIKKMLSSVI